MRLHADRIWLQTGVFSQLGPYILGDNRVIVTAIGFDFRECRTSGKRARQDQGEGEFPGVICSSRAPFNLLGTRVTFANDLYVADIQSAGGDALSDWLSRQ